MRPPSQFTTIHTEGGLLPPDLLARVAEGDKSLEGLDSIDYHLAPGERLNEAISRSWNRLLGAWENFTVALADAPDSDRTATALTRSRWTQVLFQELDYGQLQTTKALTVDGTDYPLSHLWDAVPIHLVGARVDLDRRTSGVAGAARMSPHGLVQDLLNRSDDHLWGFVSNGLRLRLLRDNVSLTRQAFLEFDLEAMLTGQAYADFVVLWLVCHQSRVEGDIPEKYLLERWSAEAARHGTRALEQLRAAVESAISTLGQGFLAHQGNTELRDRLRSGDLDRQDYYRQLLRLIYRLLFVSVAEARDVLNDPAADPTAKERYRRFYSLERIGTLAGARRGGPHGDLWAQLQLVFRALGDDSGCPALALPALGSFLWSADATPALDHSQIANRHVLAAIRTLSSTRDGNVTRAVDYRNLGSEELGSVYESLLELHPELNVDARTFSLLSAAGNERKTTGSYYTHSAIIAALLDTALDPLLHEAAKSSDPEAAILNLKVLDPSCGSGHFLIACAHRIAKSLSAVRSGEAEPAPALVRAAVRDVVGRCLYGIDLNPMAVELCKVSLWMEAVEPGKPLSFLEHRIIWGDALIGATPVMLSHPVPDEAFQAVFDDDKDCVASLKARNRREASGQGAFTLGHTPQQLARAVGNAVASIDTIGDNTSEEIHEKECRLNDLLGSREMKFASDSGDAWCAAFLAAKHPGAPAVTDGLVRRLEDGEGDTAPEDAESVRRLALQYRFVHPHLAFPGVLQIPPDDGPAENEKCGWNGGFDLVLGNPPWDTLSPDRKEYFSTYEPEIRFAKKEDQDKLVAELLDDPAIATLWRQYQRDLYAKVHFFKSSGRYRLYAPGNLGKGDFNIYRMFVETALQLTRAGGSVAQVLPGGFYGGANAMAIRRELYENWDIKVVLGFINTGEHWFNGISSATRFCAYAAQRGGPTTTVPVAFELRTEADLAAALTGGPSITVEEIRDQSPQALAIPEVVSASGAAIASRMYGKWPKFGDTSAGPPVRHYQREIDMGTDRNLLSEDPDGLPVYEGRMIDLFDHRAKAYRSGRGRSAVWDRLPFEHPAKGIVPQWRVLHSDVPGKVGSRVDRYRVGFGDVTSSSNVRSLIAALIPPGSICGDKVPNFVFSEASAWAYMPWLAVANSFAMDFLIRKKIALKVSYTVLDSMPFPRLPVDHPVIDRLGRLALRLTCTAPEMTGYWNAMVRFGWCPPVSNDATPPGFCDEDSREQARAEIDAIVARDIFGLSHDDLADVLDTFPGVRRREEKVHKEFRTRRLILECYDAMAKAAANHESYQTRLGPATR